MLFAAGGLGYFAGLWIDRVAPANALRVVGNSCLIVVICLVIWPTPLYSFSQRLFLFNPWIPVLIAFSSPLLFIASRGRKWDSLIGELSYPIYLSHILVIESLSLYAPDYANNLTCVCVTLIVSGALLCLVVLPVDRYRRRFGARPLDGGTSPKGYGAAGAVRKVSA